MIRVESAPSQVVEVGLNASGKAAALIFAFLGEAEAYGYGEVVGFQGYAGVDTSGYMVFVEVAGVAGAEMKSVVVVGGRAHDKVDSISGGRGDDVDTEIQLEGIDGISLVIDGDVGGVDGEGFGTDAAGDGGVVAILGVVGLKQLNVSF